MRYWFPLSYVKAETKFFNCLQWVCTPFSFLGYLHFLHTKPAFSRWKIKLLSTSWNQSDNTGTSANYFNSAFCTKLVSKSKFTTFETRFHLKHKTIQIQLFFRTQFCFLHQKSASQRQETKPPFQIKALHPTQCRYIFKMTRASSFVLCFQKEHYFFPPDMETWISTKQLKWINQFYWIFVVAMLV